MEIKVFLRRAKNAPSTILKRIKLSFLWFLSNIAKRSPLCLIFPTLPSMLWKIIGVKMGNNICIGQDVYLDVNYAKYITIEDDVWITSHSTIFAHRRDMDNYYIGGRYKECPQKIRPVLIKQGATIGIGAMITPGVTIGRGSVIGAGSVVVKDIPDWCLAAGSPCKVIRYLEKKPTE